MTDLNFFDLFCLWLGRIIFFGALLLYVYVIFSLLPWAFKGGLGDSKAKKRWWRP